MHSACRERVHCSFYFFYRWLDRLTVNLHSCLEAFADETASAIDLSLIEFGLIKCGISNGIDRVREGCKNLYREGDWKKRACIESAYPSPSETTKKFEELQQNSSTTVMCHRPPHREWVHVSLQVEAFGRFLDVSTSPNSYYLFAERLMHEMSKFYTNESNRQSRFCALLKEFAIFSDLENSQGLKKGRAKVDLCFHKNGKTCVLFEFKNEQSGVTSDPYTQLISDYIHFSKSEARDRSPMLLVSVVGCTLQVYGAAWSRGRLCVDPLATVSLLHVSTDPLSRFKDVAHIFAGAQTFVDHLPSSTSGPQWGPYFVGFDEYSLKYTRNIQNEVFIAERHCGMERKGDVVVKFVRRYGIDVHRCLSEVSQAPEIFEFRELPGEWYVIVMDKINGVDSMDGRHIVALRKVLDTLRDNNFVHGDLRRQNIIFLEDGTVRIIDFDWAGRSGQATYPTFLNPKISWHEGTTPDGFIEQDHDVFLVDQLCQRS